MRGGLGGVASGCLSFLTEELGNECTVTLEQGNTTCQLDWKALSHQGAVNKCDLPSGSFEAEGSADGPSSTRDPSSFTPLNETQDCWNWHRQANLTWHQIQTQGETSGHAASILSTSNTQFCYFFLQRCWLSLSCWVAPAFTIDLSFVKCCLIYSLGSSSNQQPLEWMQRL